MIARWNRFIGLFRRTEPGDSLAVARIACGLCVLWTIGSMVSAGLVQVLWLDAAHGGYRERVGVNWLVALLGGPEPAVVWTLVIGGLLGGAALVAGIAGRVAALVAGQALTALVFLNSQAAGSYDLMLTNALWILVLSRSTATLSLACRLRRGAWRSAVEVPAWPRYLLLIQLVAIYFSTGIQKLSNCWTPAGGFSALYYILQQPSWQRGDMRWIAHVYPLTQFGTALAWIWELTCPLLLLAVYFRATPNRTGRLRRLFARIHYIPVFVAIGVTMHLLTWLLM
ncbi:MAG TPA: HTTM domain-containing protein, partial [Phycisphaerae bacterium]|nr:HTTM domain-containing protein [Phycisphaerae bacterium]